MYHDGAKYLFAETSKMFVNHRESKGKPLKKLNLHAKL